jgi:hypothetical protein
MVNSTAVMNVGTNAAATAPNEEGPFAYKVDY